MNRRWRDTETKILDYHLQGAGISGYKLYVKIKVNGILYEGTLPVKVSEDDEE